MRGGFLVIAAGALVGAAAGQSCLSEFTAHELPRSMPFAFSVHGADMDGDGDVDVVLPGFDLPAMLFVNDGSRDPLFDGRYMSDCGFGDLVTSVADVDGDGDADVVASQWGFLVWYENLGGDPVSFCDRAVPGSGESTTACGGADLDGDGDTDLVAVDWPDGDTVTWYENDGAIPPGFTARPIGAAGEDGWTIRFADLEGDGDTDFIFVGNRAGALALYRNDGGTPPIFTRFDVVESGAFRADFADLDGDRDADIAAALSGPRVVWLENVGGPEPSFAEHLLDSAFGGPVRVGDMDRDGPADVVVTNSTTGALRVFLNQGGSPPSFEGCDAGAHTDGLVYSDVADIDGDYDLDVVAREWNVAIWFENPLCLADVTGDGDVNSRDFLAFLNLWTAHEPRADINADGRIDTRDVLAFLNLWVEGC